MTTEMRRAIRGRVAAVVLVAIGLASLLAWQSATRPGTADGLAIHWRLETLAGERVHVNMDAVQQQARNF